MIERRQASRYYFGAIAEIIDLDSNTELVSVTRNLSLSGCFVKTGGTLSSRHRSPREN